MYAVEKVGFILILLFVSVLLFSMNYELNNDKTTELINYNWVTIDKTNMSHDEKVELASAICIDADRDFITCVPKLLTKPRV